MKLKEFADHVKKVIWIDLDYYNHNKKERITEKVDIKFADRIISTLEKTVVKSDKSEKVIAKGKLEALNCNTGHFTFKANDDDEYAGYFD